MAFVDLRARGFGKKKVKRNPAKKRAPSKAKLSYAAKSCLVDPEERDQLVRLVSKHVTGASRLTSERLLDEADRLSTKSVFSKEDDARAVRLLRKIRYYG